uniref:DUF6792 domain-containing protein n=1 Tax=Bacillus sp. JCM 19041 TaxID=1460637 RepID=UPI000AF54ED1
EGNFDKIYGVNGAQVNVYQLYSGDQRFQRIINEEFNISRTEEDAIYALPADELEAFAIEYIEENMDTDAIVQLRSSNDLLYAIMENTRGFVTVPMPKAGEAGAIVTNEDHAGLSPLFEGLPDEEIAKWQEIMMPVADGYVESGVDGALGALEELTGLRRTLVDDLAGLKEDFDNLTTTEELDLSEYPVWMHGDLVRSHAFSEIGGKVVDGIQLAGNAYDELARVKEFQRNLGPLIDTVNGLNDSADEVFGFLVDGGYID